MGPRFPEKLLKTVARAPSPDRRCTGGFTILELLITLAIATILLGIAAPQILGTSSRFALASGRSEASAAVAAARAAASRYGRTSVLIVDVAGDRLRIEVDTTVLGGGTPVALGEVDLWGDLGLNLTASDPLVCFDPRGLSVVSGACLGRPVVIRFERGGARDSIVVGTTGRVTS